MCQTFDQHCRGEMNFVVKKRFQPRCLKCQKPIASRKHICECGFPCAEYYKQKRINKLRKLAEGPLLSTKNRPKAMERIKEQVLCNGR